MRANKKYRLNLTDQAKKIVDELTLEQKVSLMSGNTPNMFKLTPEQMAAMAEMPPEEMEKNHYNVTPYAAGGLEEYHIPPMLFADGPRGVVCGNGEATCFPVSMCRGASFL